MNSVTEKHVNHVFEWVRVQADCQPTITKERFASLTVFVEEFKRIQIENECLKAVLISAVSEKGAQI